MASSSPMYRIRSTGTKQVDDKVKRSVTDESCRAGSLRRRRKMEINTTCKFSAGFALIKKPDPGNDGAFRRRCRWRTPSDPSAQFHRWQPPFSRGCRYFAVASGSFVIIYWAQIDNNHLSKGRTTKEDGYESKSPGYAGSWSVSL